MCVLPAAGLGGLVSLGERTTTAFDAELYLVDVACPKYTGKQQRLYIPCALCASFLKTGTLRVDTRIIGWVRKFFFVRVYVSFSKRFHDH